MASQCPDIFGQGRLRDFHHKMTTYLGRIVGEAQRLDSTATAQTYPVFGDRR